MARYIDADELYRRVKTKTNPYGKPTLEYASGVKVLKMIDEQPTVEVVPNSEVEELIYKLECLLCHATGGLLSKHTYDLRTMESAVTDYVEKCCDSGNADLQDALNCQVETNAHLSGEYLSLMKENESQKAEIERLSKELLTRQSIIKSYERLVEKDRLEARKAIKRCKAEVASEIFAEIDEVLKKRIKNHELTIHHASFSPGLEQNKKYTEHAQIALQHLKYYMDDLAELKKKYTEDQT